jgi:hypothetical protein
MPPSSSLPSGSTPAPTLSPDPLPSPAQVNNCYNPLVGKVTGNLAGVIRPVNITGCIPQAAFYPLFRQWVATSGGNRNNILRRGDGTIVGSVMSVSQVRGIGWGRCWHHMRQNLARVVINAACPGQPGLL